VRSAAFSPDGKRIVTGGWDKTAKVWDAATGAEVMTLRGHSSIVCSVAFSPDGRRIVTGSYDNTAMVWDAATGAELLMLKGHSGWVLSAAFSPDGRRMVTVSCDTTAKVWEADPWWEPGNPPKKPKPVTITPKPVDEAKPVGAGGEERF
jgi:WD40 repeat protein